MRTLKEWRTARLLSLRALSEKTGLTAKSINDIENRKRAPQYRSMQVLCEALGVEAGEVEEFAAVLEERSKDAA